MKISVNIDTSGLEAKTLREQKRLAYNTATALNNTAKACQAAVRALIMQHFKIRRDRDFLLQRVRVIFASVRDNRPVATIAIVGPGRGRTDVQAKDRLLLTAFETGEEREGFVGKNVAVPNPAVARQGGNFAGSIVPGLTFKSMKLKPVAVTPRTRPDSVQFKGAAHTFELMSTAKNPLGGVYERVGPGRDDIRLVYAFEHGFQLKKLLQFVQTVEATFKDKWAVEWAIANAGNPSK